VIVTLNRLQYDKDIKFHIADYLYKKTWNICWYYNVPL